MPAKGLSLRHFLLGSGSLLVARTASAALLLFINVLLARQMSLAEVGVYLFFYNLSVVLGLVLTLGVGTAALKFISELRGEDRPHAARIVQQRAGWLNFLIAAPFIAVAIVVLEVVPDTILAPFPGLLEWGVLASVWIAAVTVRMNAFDILLAYDRPGLASFYSGFGAALATATVLSAMVLLDKAITLHFVLAVSTVTAVLSAISAQGAVFLTASRDCRGSKVIITDNAAGIKKLLATGIPIIFTKSLTSRRKEVLVIVLAAVASAESVALLGLANQIIAFIAMPVFAVSGLIQPQIARAMKSGGLIANMPRIRTLWSISLAPVLIIAALVGFFAHPVVTLTYGPEYAAIVGLLLISILGRIISVMVGPTTQVLMMTGHERFMAVFSVVEMAPLIILGAILGANFGAIGSAWAFTLSVAFSSFIVTIYIRTILKVWVFSWIFPKSLRPIS